MFFNYIDFKIFKTQITSDEYESPSRFHHSKIFETGLSDFRLLTVTEFKRSFQKLKPKIINYRDYKNFDNEKFRSDICKMNLNTTDLEGFMKTVFHIFNKHAPIKRKYIRANEAPFMTKDLHKAIMKRSKLRNKFLKSRSLSDRKNYTSQRNLCKKLLKSTKRTYFNNLDIRKVTDNRTFWKTVVPLFSNKFSKSEKINLTEGNKTISNDDELCRVFNNFFSKIVDELKIPNISNYKIDNTNDPLKEALRYFENHPSITNIKSKSFDTNFTFRDTSSSEVIKLIKTLNVKKASQKSDIPTKIVKLNADFFGNFICKNFNYCLKKGEFPCVLKHADVIPVHKKEIKSDKVNYRPVSILPNLSKIYEKLMYQQLYEHFNLIL